jgi:DnaJ-class molecular chaperone
VYACYKCKGHGFLEPVAKVNRCPMCKGTGWVQKGQLSEG